MKLLTPKREIGLVYEAYFDKNSIYHLVIDTCKTPEF